MCVDLYTSNKMHWKHENISNYYYSPESETISPITVITTIVSGWLNLNTSISSLELRYPLVVARIRYIPVDGKVKTTRFCHSTSRKQNSGCGLSILSQFEVIYEAEVSRLEVILHWSHTVMPAVATPTIFSQNQQYVHIPTMFAAGIDVRLAPEPCKLVKVPTPAVTLTPDGSTVKPSRLFHLFQIMLMP